MITPAFAFPLLAWMLAFAVHAASIESFSNSCLAIDGQFFGEDKVGFYCLTTNIDQFEYKFSL